MPSSPLLLRYPRPLLERDIVDDGAAVGQDGAIGERERDLGDVARIARVGRVGERRAAGFDAGTLTDGVDRSTASTRGGDDGVADAWHGREVERGGRHGRCWATVRY